MGSSLPRIWIITDPDHPEGPVRPAVQALEGSSPGAVGVQLRAPGACDRDLVAWGHALRAATRRTGCALTVNRRPDVAQIVDADGVHLPESGLTVAEVRRQWPALSMIGVSRHDREGVVRAARDHATFSFLSPVFPVPGKAAPMGIGGFAAQIAGVGIPTYALGGVDTGHVAPLLAAGAQGIAVQRAIYARANPGAALGALLHELDKNGPTGE